MRVGLFVTCLVDLMRPSIGFAAIKLLEAGRRRSLRPADADLLRPAGVQLGRPGGRDRARPQGRRRIRGLRLPGVALRLLQRHDQDPLWRTVRRRSRDARARGRAGWKDLGAHVVPRRSAEGRARPGRVRRYRDLPRLLRRASRAGHQEAAARAARQGSGAQGQRDGRGRDLLRLRRHVLGQVRRDLGAPCGQQVRAHRGGRRGRRRPRRSRLHAQHRRPASPPRRHANAGPARGRGPRGRRSKPGRAHGESKRCK